MLYAIVISFLLDSGTMMREFKVMPSLQVCRLYAAEYSKYSNVVEAVCGGFIVDMTADNNDNDKEKKSGV